MVLENIESKEINEHNVPRENIKVSIKNDPSNNPLVEFTLIQKKASRNGLVLYAYDEKLLESLSLTEKDGEALWSAIYHFSKDFYHVHEFHDKHNDSILPPYMKKCEDIQTNNNEALIYYLTCYENKFNHYHDYAKDLLDHVKKRLFDKVQFETLMYYRPIWDRVFYRIKGAHIYYRTLVGSKYLHSADQDKFHRLILNTEQRFRKIKLIEMDVRDRVSYADASQNNRLATTAQRVGLISLTVSFISLLISLALGLLSLYLS
jgi:hypothetical protein